MPSDKSHRVTRRRGIAGSRVGGIPECRSVCAIIFHQGVERWPVKANCVTSHPGDVASGVPWPFWSGQTWNVASSHRMRPIRSSSTAPRFAGPVLRNSAWPSRISAPVFSDRSRSFVEHRLREGTIQAGSISMTQTIETARGTLYFFESDPTVCIGGISLSSPDWRHRVCRILAPGLNVR